MNKRTLLSKSVVALLCASAATVSGCGEVLEQPSLGCPVQRGSWAVRYVLKDGQDATKACAQKAGERMGVQRYNVPGTNQNSIMLKPFTLAALEGSDPAHEPWSFGEFPAEANADDFCVASSLSQARQVVEEEALDISYTFHTVSILSRPEAPGSQLIADLTYAEGGCTAEYEAWATWPAVSCEDDQGNPSDAICNEEGHGLNLEFALGCDTSSLLCVPSKRPPSMK